MEMLRHLNEKHRNDQLQFMSFKTKETKQGKIKIDNMSFSFILFILILGQIAISKKS